MGLAEKIAEGRAALEATAEAPVETKVETPEEKPADEVVVEQPEAPAEEPQPEQSKPEEKPDNAAMAKMRREAAAARKAEQEAKAESERLRAEAAQTKPETHNAEIVDDPEPDQDDVEAHLKWQLRKQDRALEELNKWKNEQSEDRKKQEAERKKKETYDGAVAEFTRLETEFIKQAPDYEATTKHMHTRMTDAVKALYPSLTDEQAIQVANNQILTLASHYSQQHLNPVEELYYLAKERYGAPETQVETTKKASVEKVAEVRKKAASSLTGGGTGTKPFQPPRTPRETMRWTPEQRAAYINGLQK